MGQNEHNESDCIFCKIAKGEIPTEKLYDDGEVFVIKDIAPLTPVHLLIIPHKHVPTLMDLAEDQMDLVAGVFLVAKKMAKEQGVDEKGFRLFHNVNEWGAQVVFHMHFHLIGGIDLRSNH